MESLMNFSCPDHAKLIIFYRLNKMFKIMSAGVIMIPFKLDSTKTPLRIHKSIKIGLPSPRAISSERFPGVMIGADPVIGEHCVIFGNVFIGEKFRCGREVLIRDNVAIGDHVSIGDISCIEANVSIADHVVIGNDVWVAQQTTIGSNVIINPHVRFLNILQTEQQHRKRSRPGVILEDGCSIGENAKIGPGVCIGAGACVADGALVTRDISSHNYGMK
jgi:UDP-3-O-[3-hydroxymyristoyl] glucosamine N-acyltransferase